MTKALGVLISGLVLLLILFKLNFLRVNHITVKEDQVNCLTGDATRDLNLSNQNIFLVNGQDLTNKLSAKYLCVKKVKLSRKFPSSVDVTIEGKKAVLSIFSNPASDSAILDASSEATPKQFLADEDGLLFEEGENGSLPRVEDLNDDLKLGFSLGNKVGDILLINQKINEFKIVVAGIKIEQDDLLVSGDNPKQIVFNLKNDVKKELASLQLILEAGKMNSEETSGVSGSPKVMERVDLRFDKPVIVYSSKK